MDELQRRINAQLEQIEREQGVRIPLAIESGSRSWGFASPDSDYDCRFVYVRPREQYLTVFERRDVIELPADPVYDMGGWDVRKVVQHLVKSNAVMLEWLSSPVVYRMDEAVRGELWALGEAFFNPVAVCWHYLSLARGKLRQIEEEAQAKLKTYCYVLRPLACIRFVHDHGRFPYMEYRRNLAAMELDAAVRARIEALLARKATAGEAERMAPDEVLLDYFRRECAWAEAWLGGRKHRKLQDPQRADAVFRRVIGMVYGDE